MAAKESDDRPVNPYNATPLPSDSDASERLPSWRLVPVAIALITVSTLGLLMVLLGTGDTLRLYVNGVLDFQSDWPVLAYWALNGLVCSLIIFGTISMLRGDSYQRAVRAGRLAVIPILGPCYILAIPFGIWALIVLRNPDVKERFSPLAKIADRPPEDYTTCDEAIAAAVRLDQLGEWDAAVALYEHVAQRWPDQRDYIASCLKDLKEKQALP